MNDQMDRPKTSDDDATAAGPLEALQTSRAEQNESYLRLAADFENFKRRSRQESETRSAAQKEAFIIELLPVVDNLERALSSGAASSSAQFHRGVEMTLKQLRHLLYQHGVESDEILGSPFDPHRHEALSQGHDPEQPDQAVLAVLQRGYRRGEKVIRPAKVTVNDPAASKSGSDGS